MASSATLKLLLLGEDRSAGKTLKGVGDDADRSAGKFHGFAKAAGVALAGGLLVAGAAAIKFTQAAAEDDAASHRLAQTMHQAAGATKAQTDATEDWIAAQGKALGVSDDQLRPALSKLVVATRDVDEAQRLASLAMDVSAGSGKSLESISAALAKAQNGNVSALGRLGIATKDQDGKTKSLKEITKDLSDLYGGAAASNAETVAGKQQRLKVALDEAGESLGQKLLPFMLQLTDAGTAALDWMGKHPDLLKQIAIGAGVLAGALVTLRIGMALSAATTGIMTAVTAAQAVAAGTATEAQIALNAAMRANVIGIVVTVLALLVTAFIAAYQNSETFRDKVNTAFRAVANVAIGVWNNLLAPVFELWGKALGLQLSMWAALLHLLGKVPGFGWAKDLADKLDNAANKASNLNLKLDQIDGKKVGISITETHIVKQVGGVPLYKSPDTNAVGTRFFAGGATWVGERGAELLNLPRGSSVTTQDSMRSGSAESTQPLVININGALDPVAVGQQVEQVLSKYQRTALGGRPLAFTSS